MTRFSFYTKYQPLVFGSLCLRQVSYVLPAMVRALSTRARNDALLLLQLRRPPVTRAIGAVH